MKRSLSIILALALLISAFVCIVPTAEEERTGSLEICSANLQFGSNIYLMVAVDYSDLYDSYDAAKAGVTVKITEKNGRETILTADDSVAETDGFPTNSVGFKHTTLPAKGMGDVLTIQAYAGGEASGESIIYSILEYAIKTKSEYPDDAPLCNAIDAMIEFGAEAQKAFEHDFDYDLTKDHTIAKLVGGAKFANGYAKTILEEGADPVTATHPDYTSDAIWYNTSLQVRGNEPTLSISYTGKTETYFAAPSSIAGSNGLDVGAIDTPMYYYGIEYTLRYTESSGKFKNEAPIYVVRDGVVKTTDKAKNDWGTDWWLYGSSIPAGSESTTGAPAGNALDYTIGSEKFANYLKENSTLSDEAVDALSLVEKWNLKDANSKQYYDTFKKAAIAEVHTYEEVVAGSTAYGIFDTEGEYLRYTGTHNFNSTIIAKDIYNAVSAYANGDTTAESSFTITLSMAADGADVSLFKMFSIRNNNHPTDGSSTTVMVGSTKGTRLSFLHPNTSKSVIKTGYKKDGSSTSGTAIKTFDISGVEAGSCSEFVTFHIVFDLAAREMRYYSEGNANAPIITVKMPTALDIKAFFGTQNLPSFNGQLNAGNIGYLRTFVVTAGDITDYMK